MKSIVEQSHAFLLPVLHKQAICIDGTVGHGKDTQFFLKNNVKKVYGFEIQEDVLNKTVDKIKNASFLAICDGHEKMDQYVQEEVDAVVFNFGYCPGIESDIVTKPETSLKAIQKSLSLLKVKGRMVLVMYPHKKGQEEAKLIEEYLKMLNSNLFYIEKRVQLNQVNSPYMIGVEKRRL